MISARDSWKAQPYGQNFGDERMRSGENEVSCLTYEERMAQLGPQADITQELE